MTIAFISALVSAMLINNIILMQFLGICPFLGVSKKIDASIGMSAAVGFVMLLSSIITWPIFHYILKPLSLEYMMTIVFILIIASTVQIVEMFLKKKSPNLYKSLGVYLPLITTNCAILGVANSNITADSTFLLSTSNAIGSALGFALVMVAFSAIREKLDTRKIPKSFQGIPISLVIASLMSMAFFGFGGVI